MRWTDELRAAARGYGVEDAHPRLVRFIELFLKWNERINLSAARSPEDVTLQVVDCLALCPHLDGVSTLLDVGSGGGLPGLVLAIALPHLQVRSVEPVHKKAAFQSNAVRDLALPVDVQPRRVDPAIDNNFDAAVSRATFDLPEWLSMARPMVKPGGLILGMEGRDQRTLPPGATRLPYAHGDRTRAIIVYRPT